MSAVTSAPTLPRPAIAASGVGLCCVVIATLFVLHIVVGARPVPAMAIWDSIIQFDPRNFDHVIVRDLRLPRALIAILVGAALSISGAIMQGVTRNPLADPGLLGLMAGAGFAVVMSEVLFGLASPWLIPPIAAIGSLGAAILVFIIARWSSQREITPLTLTLAGTAVSAFLAALVAMAKLAREESFENLRVWLSGSIAGGDMTMVIACAPWLIGAGALGLALGRQVTALAMGEDVAKGLGVRTGRLRAQLLLVVVVLTAASVALVGPMGFVGLVIPHVVRLFVGSDYRWIVLYSALFGAIYLLGIDILARVIIAPREISAGILTAIIGAPFFIYLVRRRSR